MPPTRPACYGGMFPDLTRLEHNVPCRGQALTVELRSAGIGVQRRELRVDDQAWDRCAACPDYRTCYDLGLAKLMLRGAIQSL
jgi:hypothetical protein